MSQPLHPYSLAPSLTAPSLLIPQENPYVMRRPNFQALSGNERFEGFCVDMLRELAELLRFRYRLRLVEDGLYGAPEPNGSWTGMVGELINRVRPSGGQAGVSGPAWAHSRKGRKDTDPVGCPKWPTLLCEHQGTRSPPGLCASVPAMIQLSGLQRHGLEVGRGFSPEMG